jgi:hypothetical protein
MVLILRVQHSLQCCQPPADGAEVRPQRCLFRMPERSSPRWDVPARDDAYVHRRLHESSHCMVSNFAATCTAHERRFSDDSLQYAQGAGSMRCGGLYLQVGDCPVVTP